MREDHWVLDKLSPAVRGRVASKLLQNAREKNSHQWKYFVKRLAELRKIRIQTISQNDLQKLVAMFLQHAHSFHPDFLVDIVETYLVSNNADLLVNLYDSLNIKYEGGRFLKGQQISAINTADYNRFIDQALRLHDAADVFLAVWLAGMRDENLSAPEATFTQLLELTEKENVEDKDNLSTVVHGLKMVRRGIAVCGKELAGISKEMVQGSLIPPADLIARLTELRESIIEVAKELNQLLPPESQRDISNLVSVDELEAVLEMVRTATSIDTRLALAQEILAKVSRIRHRDNPAVLEKVWATAADLKNAIASGEREIAEQLIYGMHPLAQLVDMIEKRDGLNDEKAVQMQQTIAGAFGHILTTAALMGKLVIAEQQDGGEAAPPVAAIQPAQQTMATGPPPHSAEETGTLPDDDLQGEDTTMSTDVRVETSREKDSSGDSLPEEISIRKGAATPARKDERRVEEVSPKPIGKTPSTLSEEQGPEQLVRTESDPRVLARSILASDRPEVLQLSDLLWRLVEQEHIPLAYHISRWLDTMKPGVSQTLPPWLLATLCLKNSLVQPDGLIAAELKRHFAEFRRPEGEDKWSDGVRLLILSSVLRPALLSPTTGAPQILNAMLPEGYETTYIFTKAIADFGNRNHPLDPTVLHKVRDRAAWDAQVAELGQCARDFLKHERTIKFQRGTEVWNRWKEKEGDVRLLLDPVIGNQLDALEKTRQTIQLYPKTDKIKELVRRTEKELFGKHRYNPIEARALEQLVGRFKEALDIASSWVKLHNARNETKTAGFLQNEAGKLRDALQINREATVAELKRRYEQAHNEAPIAIGIDCLINAIHNVMDLFKPDVPLHMRELKPSRILNGDLLSSRPIALDTEWRIIDDEPIRIGRATAALVAEGVLSWAARFDLRCELKDHIGSGLILDMLTASNSGESQIDNMREKREQCLADCRKELKEDIRNTRNRLEMAAGLGLLNMAELSNHSSVIESMENITENNINFNFYHRMLAGIRDALDRLEKDEVDKVKQRLEDAVQSKNPEVAARIHALLDKSRDVLTATEYIDMFLDEKDLPQEQESSSSFNTFFPVIAETLYKGLSDISQTDVVKKVKNRQPFCDIDMKAVPENIAKNAADMLNAWFSVKTAQRMTETQAITILEGLGFTIKTCTPEAAKREKQWLSFETEVLKDKNQCPVPLFGSEANGHYKVLCIWGRPTEEDILNDVSERQHQSSVIVFFFGRQSDLRRRDLAFLCRERERSFLVLDETLLVYLCSGRHSRLPVFFECTLPFAFQKPYRTTASLVPPEVFYGRQRELQEIAQPEGSWFIYGGRQLGKTALLREVERREHQPYDRIARWIDLKEKGIGYNRNIDEIWQILGIELKKTGVIREIPRAPEKLFEEIENWLNANGKRKILLLLDEADKFFEMDAPHLTLTTRLKGLMDRTNRRFKVVFAGLHNVQRTHKDPNSSLGHTSAICIGPLEFRDARDLVKRPLESSGYRFESDDLITRILSLTNYYPSLIQLYCSQLMDIITDRQNLAKFERKSSPPFTITERHLEELTRKQELSRDIRHRFMLTLQLDLKYEVIAYTMARGYMENQNRQVEGFPVTWLRNEATGWWPEGFQSSSSDHFRVLLEEMVGLGVLRTSEKADHYSLRSPNVVKLMGTKEEIEDVLLKEGRERPSEYAPTEFRSGFDLDTATGERWYSPLTAKQVFDLKSESSGVAIICGNRASGLHQVNAFFKNQPIMENTHEIQANDLATFTKKLKAAVGKTTDRGTLVLLSHESPWGDSWIKASSEMIASMKDGRFLKVVLLADPGVTWRISQAGLDDDNVFKNTQLLNLGPWSDGALRQALVDFEIGSISRSDRDKIASVTGGWAYLVEKFFASTRLKPANWKQNLLQFDQSLVSEITRTDLMEAFFGTVHEGIRVLQLFADYEEPLSLDEIATLNDGLGEEKIRTAMKWGESLNLLSPRGAESLTLDPVATRIIKTSS